VPSKRGLPKVVKMRHDRHFVEQLSSRLGAPIGKMISIRDIVPSPDQPRSSLGNLEELKNSIREKGLLEPLVVRFHKGKYHIIAGERRYRACYELGLKEVPCVEREVDQAEALELGLIENLQRKDLSPFEETAGLHLLCEKFGYTHEEIAKRIGKSRVSVTETISLNRIPERVRYLCQKGNITSKSILLEIARQTTEQEMSALVSAITGGKWTRERVRKEKRKSSERGNRSFFTYKSSDGSFFLNLRFTKKEISREEIIKALKEILKHIEG